MSLTYGFYNSRNGDRKYDAEQMSSMFDGLITDGIFESIGDKLMVSERSGMTVSVGTGRAWFNHTWTLNDAVLSITVDASELILNRIDTIVIDINKSERTHTISIVKGIPATNPVRPDLVYDNGAEHYQYPLCDIYVKSGATAIKQADITNRVGIDCPFVTGAVESVKVDELVAQWQDQFNTWFDALRDMLDENAETKIAAEILDLQGQVTTCERIWVNSSLTSAFPAQHITFARPIKNIEVYDALYIRCRFNTNYGYEQTILLTSEMGSACIFPSGDIWGVTMWGSYSRHFIWGANSVQVSAATRLFQDVVDNKQMIESVSDHVIPVAIYGIKWGKAKHTL